MVSIETFTSIANSFPQISEQPHFEKHSFRVGKKIFATLDISKQQACIKLSPADQDIFSAFDKTIIFSVPRKWGKQGWTFIDLQTVPEAMLAAALKSAYCSVAPTKLVAELSAADAKQHSENDDEIL
ncbi:MmcQ/YjbR family DNA-binding protein [soil metagenome]